MFGGWLAALAGAWFVVGQAFASPLNIGSVGQPAASTDLKFAWLEVTYFTGLGALIVFLGAAALGRVAVRHARDVAVTHPAPVAAPVAGAEERARPRVGGGLFRRHHHAGA